VFRIAITNTRIVGLDDDTVRIHYRDRKTGRRRTCRLSGEEFMRRFLQHVLPHGFHKVRYFGLWHPSQRPSQTWGGNVSSRRTGGGGREWRVRIELNGADGTKQTHEVSRGGGADPHSTFDPLGLTLDDGKILLAGVQRHLIQARVAEYCALRPPLFALPGPPP